MKRLLTLLLPLLIVGCGEAVDEDVSMILGCKYNPNAKYLDKFPDHQFFVDPVAHDGGTAVGAAIRLGRALKQGEEI